jgi:hypothetical protein
MTTHRELRLAAAAMGEKTYTTGKTCKHGHMARRYVSTGGCVECVNGLPTLARITADMQPWIPLPLQVPIGLPVAALDDLNDYLYSCVRAWMEGMGMMTMERAAALTRLQNARVNQRLLRDAGNAVPVPVAPAAAPPPKAADVPQREPLTRERFGR